jgi:hypothetical protein
MEELDKRKISQLIETCSLDNVVSLSGIRSNYSRQHKQ